MMPYFAGMVRDLRVARFGQVKLRRISQDLKPSTAETYPQRRRRYEVQDEVERLASQERSILAELRKLGVEIGSVARGELLFPCLVDDRPAAFIWYDGEERPTCFRVRGEQELKRIPERWFSVLMPERQRREPRPRM
jgi:hypothetical protein